jgi:hypothetical protein
MTAQRRPFIVQALAGLLTFYAMAGAWLAMTMGTTRDPRFYWVPLVIGGAAFAISAGIAALAVWRLEARAPLTLMICAVVGATLCTAMPAAVRGAMITRDTWLLAIAGGLLFAAFLLLAARYVRLYLRSIG